MSKGHAQAGAVLRRFLSCCHLSCQLRYRVFQPLGDAFGDLRVSFQLGQRRVFVFLWRLALCHLKHASIPVDRALFQAGVEMDVKKAAELPDKGDKKMKKAEPMPSESEDDFIPASKDSIEIIDDAFSDDSKDDDDWSAVPSFLRRKK